MPRTKAVKKKASGAAGSKISDKNITKSKLFKELELLRENDIKAIEALRDTILANMKERMDYGKMELKHPNRTLKEQRLIDQSMMMKTACDNLNGLIQSTEKIPKKNRRSRSCTADDDGYITGDSASGKGKRKSRARSRALPLANSTTRASRSLSSSHTQQIQHLPKTTTKKQGYTTPLKQQPSNTYGMVTPKMKPNAPQLLLRRPKHGEVAISLEGSPLMVNPVATDSTANVNIPLGDGKLLSLHPGRGLRMSQVPEIDDVTRRQLISLKDHIRRICGDTHD